MISKIKINSRSLEDILKSFVFEAIHTIFLLFLFLCRVIG